jgi:uncharacterized protein (DUF1800 family)
MRERGATLAALGVAAAATAACSKIRSQEAPPKSPSPAPAASGALTPTPIDARQARRALNRLAFGPRPGDVEALVKQGFTTWLDAQLDAKAKTPAIAALEPYAGALVPPDELVQRALGDDADMDMDMGGKEGQKALRKRITRGTRQQIQTLALAELTRHILSPRQTHEVLTDFWTNHFNVFARKGLVQLFAGDYIERAIRPHALGRFEDLLIATAQHPAMLLYLDNAGSVREPDVDMPKRGKKRRGLNENYARELLELHTLGVDGGYTQADVIDVARILTGFSVTRPRDGELRYVFRERAHDRGEKKVLGKRFPAGVGEAEGLELLRMLAAHPSTARHLSRKLAARLVSDTPPQACIDAGQKAFLATKGDIAQVVRAIVSCPEFFAEKSHKLKSPLELMVSAARAFGIEPDGSPDLAKTMALMGQPMLLEPVPTGFPEAEVDWLGSSGMLARMSFASAVGTQSLPGVELDLDRVLPNPAEDIAKRTARHLFGESAPAALVALLESETQSVDDAEDKRAVAVALSLGSPEYQRQ